MRPLLPLFAATLAASAGYADFAERWTLIHSSSATLGYDSNVYGNSRDEDVTSDAYAELAQALSLARRNSLTRLKGDARLYTQQYLDERDASSVDGSVSFDAGFPADADDPQTWRAQASWKSVTAAVLELNERVRRTEWRTYAENVYELSPKFGALGRFDFYRSSYANERFNANSAFAGTLGVVHQWSPKLQWSGEYNLEFGRSEASFDSGRDVDSRQHTVGVRARGRLLTKLTGSLFLGAAWADFSGDVDEQKTGPSAAADLRWAASELTELRTALAYRFDFSAEGEAVRSLTWSSIIEHDFSVAWRAGAAAEAGHTQYDRSVRDRRDMRVGGRIFAEWSVSPYFSGEASLGYSRNDSTESRYDADRTFLSVGFLYRY